MAQIIRFQGKHGDEANWLNWDVVVHNRSELDTLVNDVRIVGYQSFTLTTDEGTTIVEGRSNADIWHNFAGFRA